MKTQDTSNQLLIPLISKLNASFGILGHHLYVELIDKSIAWGTMDKTCKQTNSVKLSLKIK